MIEITVPETLRICPGCGELVSGGEGYCASCVSLLLAYDARYHAERKNELFSQLPRVCARVDDGLGAFRGVFWGLLIEAAATLLIAALSGFLVGRFS